MLAEIAAEPHPHRSGHNGTTPWVAHMELACHCVAEIGQGNTHGILQIEKVALRS